MIGRDGNASWLRSLSPAWGIAALLLLVVGNTAYALGEYLIRPAQSIIPIHPSGPIAASLVMVIGLSIVAAWVLWNLWSSRSSVSAGPRQGPQVGRRAAEWIAAGAVLAVIGYGLVRELFALGDLVGTRFLDDPLVLNGKILARSPMGAALLGTLRIGTIVLAVQGIVALVFWVIRGSESRFPSLAGAAAKGFRLLLTVFASVPCFAVLLWLRTGSMEAATEKTVEFWLLTSVASSDVFNAAVDADWSYLCTGVAVGLQASAGLWVWLEGVWARARGSDGVLLNDLAGVSRYRTLARDVLWLGRVEAFGVQVAGGVASALLIEALSGNLLEALSLTAAPTHHSLGSIAFLLNEVADPRFVDVAGGLSSAATIPYGLAVIAAGLALLPAAFPHRRARPWVRGGTLEVGGRPVLKHPPLLARLESEDGRIWVLGTSGSGKSSLLRYWADLGTTRVSYAPQSPDDFLILDQTVPEFVYAICQGNVDRRATFSEWLVTLGDQRIAHALDNDDFTSLRVLSRGERQRLVALALLCRPLLGGAVAQLDALILDEATAAQDHDRLLLLLELIRKEAEGRFKRVAIATHDAEVLEKQLVADGVLTTVIWLTEGEAAIPLVCRGAGASVFVRLGAQQGMAQATPQQAAGAVAFLEATRFLREQGGREYLYLDELAALGSRAVLEGAGLGFLLDPVISSEQSADLPETAGLPDLAPPDAADEGREESDESEVHEVEAAGIDGEATELVPGVDVLGDVLTGGLVEKAEAVLVEAAPPRAAVPQPSDARLGPLARIERPDSLRAGGRELKIFGLEPAAGHIIVLSGPSGVGKSTYCRELVRRAHRLSPEGLRVGYVPQEPGRALTPNLTLVEAICPRGLRTPADLERRLQGEACFQDLASRLDKRCGELSEGQRQRVLLAREWFRLDVDPGHGGQALWVLDEPFVSTDPVNHLRMVALVAKWVAARPDDRAAVLASHQGSADAHVAQRALAGHPARVIVERVRFDHVSGRS